jgi:carboxyl-terminal processing protease
MQDIHNTDDSVPKRSRFKRILRPGVYVVLLSAVFIFGVNVGKGNIVFGPDAIYRKSAKNGNQPEKLDYSGVNELYEDLKQSFDGQLDAQVLESGLKEGLVRAAGDPFTEYLDEEASKEFNEQLNGSFEGIGAELSKDKESIVIVSPIAGFPADKAGLKAKDIISKINGETAYDISVTEAVKRIRGPKGTTVKLEILRDGKALNFEVIRDQIVIPSVTHEVATGNIGIIKITRFSEDTLGLTEKAALDLKSKGVKGVILDVRGNPGGLLNSSVKVSSLWLKEGSTVLVEKRDNQVVKTYKAQGKPMLLGVPTVVLVDEGSASASEIVAGALRDNKAATIIGTKTYGKGSVQEIRELRGGGTLKVTIARWFTPGDRNIDKEGIEPDQKVEISEQDQEAKRDPQKDAAIQRLAQ